MIKPKTDKKSVSQTTPAVTEKPGEKSSISPRKTSKKRTVKAKPAKNKMPEKKKPVSRKPEEPFDLGDSEWYLNRELTWLEFNRRVLHEAEDERTPLLERLKFIAIVNNNLDEFFMKRIGGLKQQIGAGVKELTLDGRTPRRQVEECHVVIRELNARMIQVFREVRVLLEQKGILYQGA